MKRRVLVYSKMKMCDSKRRERVYSKNQMYYVIEKEGVGPLHDYVSCDSKRRVLVYSQMFCVTEKGG